MTSSAQKKLKEKLRWAFASEVFVRDGHIFLKDMRGENQLTFWGLDKSPFLLDNGKILFIRQEEALSHGHKKLSVVQVYYTPTDNPRS